MVHTGPRSLRNLVRRNFSSAHCAALQLHREDPFCDSRLKLSCDPASARQTNVVIVIDDDTSDARDSQQSFPIVGLADVELFGFGPRFSATRSVFCNRLSPRHQLPGVAVWTFNRTGRGRIFASLHLFYDGSHATSRCRSRQFKWSVAS